MPEPWLRNTHLDLDPIPRAVIHALELTTEDAARWTTALTETELFAIPLGLPSVAFQFRHIVRSLDRLLTYAEGSALTATQLAMLTTEAAPGTAFNLRTEFADGIAYALTRVHVIAATAEPRYVGRDRIPTTIAGLLIHCADHTQRHTGQLITTAKIIQASPLKTG